MPGKTAKNATKQHKSCQAATKQPGNFYSLPACVNNTNLVCFEYRVWVGIMNMIIGSVGILNMIIGSVGILIGLLVF